MSTDILILLTLSYSEKGMIAGRTLFQKTLYFLNEKLHLGIDFIPYYYGPYSAEVADAISGLKAAGIVEEEVETFSPFNFNVTFEPRRYIYQLTDIGKTIAGLMIEKEKEKAEIIKSVLEDMKKYGASGDYKTLSIAAKMHDILTIEGKPMTPEEILQEAEALNWKISEHEAQEAAEFLEAMNLIRVQQAE